MYRCDVHSARQCNLNMNIFGKEYSKWSFMILSGAWPLHDLERCMTIAWSWAVHDHCMILSGAWALHDLERCMSIAWSWAVHEHCKIWSGEWYFLIFISGHLRGALSLPYVPARVTRGAFVAHGHSFAPSRCRTSQYPRTFLVLSVSLWNDLNDPVFDGAGLAGFKSRANA